MLIMLNVIKKILFVSFLLFSFQVADAQIKKYNATSYSYKTYNYTYKVWSGWSEWIKCNVKVYVNFDTDVITIYSSKTQVYRVISSSDAYIDESNGVQVKFFVIDQDGDKGTLRIRVQDDGSYQLYVDFADIMWVYNITPLPS